MRPSLKPFCKSYLQRENFLFHYKLMVLVVFLDIDGTIIGDITYQVLEWEIISAVSPKKLAGFRSRLAQTLKEGMLRPFLAEFMSTTAPPQTYIFPYTASDDKWASFLVPVIEQVTGVKFMRPILSRKNCGFHANTFTKSLSLACKSIHRSIKKDLPNVSLSQLEKSCVLIDNNDTLVESRSKWIACPTYNHIQPTNVLSMLSEDEIQANLRDIIHILEKYGFSDMSSQSSLRLFYSMYYLKVAKLYKTHSSMSSETRRDDFWLKLANVMSQLIRKDALSRDNFIKLSAAYL
jgi:hypothetical protein